MSGLRKLRHLMHNSTQRAAADQKTHANCTQLMQEGCAPARAVPGQRLPLPLVLLLHMPAVGLPHAVTQSLVE